MVAAMIKEPRSLMIEGCLDMKMKGRVCEKTVIKNFKKIKRDS